MQKNKVLEISHVHEAFQVESKASSATLSQARLSHFSQQLKAAVPHKSCISNLALSQD